MEDTIELQVYPLSGELLRYKSNVIGAAFRIFLVEHRVAELNEDQRMVLSGSKNFWVGNRSDIEQVLAILQAASARTDAAA